MNDAAVEVLRRSSRDLAIRRLQAEALARFGSQTFAFTNALGD
jgi:hypothetical protein